MNRPGSFLVALSMVAISASVAVLAFTLGGIDLGISIASGLGLLLALVIGHIGAQLTADRVAVEARLDLLTRTAGDLARDVATLSERMERFDPLIDERIRLVGQTRDGEIRELGDLVKRFAETLQDHAETLQLHAGAIQGHGDTLQSHEQAILSMVRAPAAAYPGPPQQAAPRSPSYAPPQTPPAFQTPAPSYGQPFSPPVGQPVGQHPAQPAAPSYAPAPPPPPSYAQPAAPAFPPATPLVIGAPPPPPVQVLQRQAAVLRRQATGGVSSVTLPEALSEFGRSDAIAVLDEAISAKRYELFLQPIVTLPQRKVRFYQASVRLRTANGRVLLPEDYRPLADDAGLMATLDREVLARCVQIVRRLTARNRDVSLICDLAGSSLADTAFANELVASLEASRGIAGSLMLGFGQTALRNMTSLDVETLRTLADKGFRFVMGDVRDLRIEPRDLAEKGIRLVKVPSDMMVARAAETGASIHVADLAGLFSRYGMDLVVEDVESETVVVDLLDYDVKFALGTLFSPPRPVRADVMSTAEPAGAQATAVPASRTRGEPRVEPRGPLVPSAPQTLGAAVLAQGALMREPRRTGTSSGLRALIRDRS